MTEKEAAGLMAALKAAYPRQEIAAPTIKLYARMLGDIDPTEGKEAVQRLIASSRFFPTVAEIREEVFRAHTEGLPEPEVAWRYVLEAIGKFGAYGSPSFEGEAMNEAIRAVGWRDICLSESVASSRARFVDAYRVCRERQTRRLQLGGYAPERKELPPAVNKIVEGLSGRLKLLKGGSK